MRSAPVIALAARLGRADAMSEAIALVKAGKASAAEQDQYLELFAASGSAEALPLVVDLLRKEKNEARRAQQLAALGRFDQSAAADALFELYSTLRPRHT